MNTNIDVMEEDWEVLKRFLPADWEQLAVETGALKGLRKDKDPAKLLRTLLLHIGCGYSLRETALRAKLLNLAQISDVALLKRLRKSCPWLHQLCVKLFEKQKIASVPENVRGIERPLLMMDGTIISESGPTGSQWRVHYCLQYPSLNCEFFRLAPVKGAGNGESLKQFPIRAGAHYLADRGFCAPPGIAHVVEAGGHLTLRVNPAAIRIYEEDGQSLFDMRKHLKSKVRKPGASAQWAVRLADKDANVVAAGRLCVIRKSRAQAQASQKKLRAKAHKNKTKVSPHALFCAQFIIVFTTLGSEEFTADEILEIYRLRWQIELVFKRFKQLADLGQLPKHDPVCVEAWLYGKLLVALLTEALIAEGNSFFPWGYPLNARFEERV